MRIVENGPLKIKRPKVSSVAEDAGSKKIPHCLMAKKCVVRLHLEQWGNVQMSSQQISKGLTNLQGPNQSKKKSDV